MTRGFALTLLIETRVDPERREQPRVVANARKIVADVVVLPEDRAAAVAALDRAVEIVPLIDPAERGIRLLPFVQTLHALMQRELA